MPNDEDPITDIIEAIIEAIRLEARLEDGIHQTEVAALLRQTADRLRAYADQMED